MGSILDRIKSLSRTSTIPTEHPIVVTTSSGKSIEDALKVFGHTEFRGEQRAVIEEAISGTDGILAVFPTGFGKSVAYQIPPIVTGKLTVVVSPLISLMRDQVTKLQKLGINAVFINSSVPDQDCKIALLEVQSGSVVLMYVAPERFANKRFSDMMNGIKIDLLAIDECHCISRYGNDFRPSYAELGGVIERYSPRQVIALTATATKQVQDDICASLNLSKAKRFVSGVYRPNLNLVVVGGIGWNRTKEIARVVSKRLVLGHNTGIVYSATRKEAEEICKGLNDAGIQATFYHAGLKDSVRSEVQDNWAQNGGIIVATCAFGMGIDRPNVRFVIHSGLSQSIEDWWQEVGRAGRDGKPSLCMSMWDYARDYSTQMYLIDLTNPSGKDVDKFWKWILSEAEKVGTGTVRISKTQKEMSEESGCANVGSCVSFLKKENLVQTVGRGEYDVVVDKNRTLDTTVLDVIRADKILKLDQVVGFYNSKGCRFSYIRNYFGDTSSSGSCGHCDQCVKA